jgi:acylphosphatase
MGREDQGAPSRKRLQALVHGRVQGVSFRYYARQRARAFGLVGWVRNREDGTVEVLAEGQESDLRCFLSWLHAGPSLAHVTRVETEWAPARGDLISFEVRY